MPDDVDARGAGEGRSTAFDEHSPDLVGEELADDARIWRVYDKVAREEDRERVSHWNRGLDNLALFAGLFSAVTTAFIIEAQQDTEPDYARLTFLVLNASAAGVPFREEPFVVDSSVRLTNCLWIASLMLSLSAALIAIMGKDWIGMYLSRPACNPRQWAEIRTYRLTCVERWYMSGVIASAPVLLHVSLVLFAAGLVVFVSPDPFSQRVALGLALTAGCLYLIIVLSAVVFPTSPFKSPATQAVRRSVLPLLVSLGERLVYSPKRHPIAMLQQAAHLLSAALSLSLSPDTIPLTHARPRRMRRADIALLWDHLAGSDVRRRWRDTSGRCVTAVSERLVAFFRLLHSLARSALYEYQFRRQRPRTRPWRASLLLRLCEVNIFDPWSDVRSEPSLELLAQSLSHLNAMTQSPEVFGSILVALGDIAIGRKVAPLVSPDLRLRLTAEIRRNWPKAELLPLARLMLVDRHLSPVPLIPSSVIKRFGGRFRESGVKSETIVFALVGLCYDRLYFDKIVSSCWPDIVIQPRALQHLLAVLPSFADPNVVIMVAYHYWDHWHSDNSVNLEAELRRRVQSWAITKRRDDVVRRLRCVDGLVELLVFISDETHSELITRTITFGLILKVIAADPVPRHHPCIIPALGCSLRWHADAVWAALNPKDLSSNWRLELALPLDDYTSNNWQNIVNVSHTYHSSQGPTLSFETCLARTVVRLLWASRILTSLPREPQPVSGRSSMCTTVELGTRFLHTQLCHWRSSLSARDRYNILELLLEGTVFAAWTCLWLRSHPNTDERIFLNILTATARCLADSVSRKWLHNPRKTLCSFVSSTANSSTGRPTVWDLRAYLRRETSPFHWSSQQEISLHRLHRAIRSLRPIYALYKCPEMWDRIGLPHDKEYGAPFWDDEGFALGPLLPQDDGIASVESPPRGAAVASVVSQGSLALHYLDASMR